MANKWRELTRKVRDEKADTPDKLVDQCGFENDIRSGKGQFNWPGTKFHFILLRFFIQQTVSSTELT